MEVARAVLSLILMVVLILGGYELFRGSKKKPQQYLGCFMLICGLLLMSTITSEFFINLK